MKVTTPLLLTETTLMEFEVQKATRRCVVNDREFEPGEPFYSMLREVDGDILREDYSESAWKGVTEDCIGWWKARMPEADTSKINWAPNDVMMHYFQQLEESIDKHDLRYVLALLMVRRRILKMDRTEAAESGAEQLVLFCPRDEQEYRVAVFSMGQERIKEIQDELSGMLFADTA